MKTYQDLLLRRTEAERGAFCRQAVNEFMMSRSYREAKAGEAYYNKHNTTIEKYQKMLFTVSGQTKPDLFSANYKLKTLIFRRLVTQQVQYVLSNGLTLSGEDSNKKKLLGKDFDFQLQLLAKKAMAQGRAFGYWNNDHLEVFGYADTGSSAGFCPLYDESTADLVAGIRYWFKAISDKHTLFRATLYEPDGFTEYKQLDEEAVEVLEPKRGYKQTVKASEAFGVEAITYENYTEFLKTSGVTSTEQRSLGLTLTKENSGDALTMQGHETLMRTWMENLQRLKNPSQMG